MFGRIKTQLPSVDAQRFIHYSKALRLQLLRKSNFLRFLSISESLLHQQRWLCMISKLVCEMSERIQFYQRFISLNAPLKCLEIENLLSEFIYVNGVHCVQDGYVTLLCGFSRACSLLMGSFTVNSCRWSETVFC